jgi:hypothetical protein
MARRWLRLGGALTLLLLGLSDAAPTASAAGNEPALTAVDPARLLDTRPAATVDGRFANIGRLMADTELAVGVTGRGGVPTDATVAALNLTVVDPAGAGFVTAYPCGSPKPNTSNVNFTSGQTVANLSIVKLSADGRVCFVSDKPTHLIADVTAFSTPLAPFSPIAPARIFESRPAATFDGQQTNVGKLIANATTQVHVGGRAGVPSNAAVAALNVTVADPAAAGFVTVYPCGEPKPNASTVNFRAGQTVANLTLSKLGIDGNVCVVSDQAIHLIVDVTAFAPAGTTLGTLSPMRLLDTRPAATIDGRYSNTQKLRANVVVDLPVSGRASVPVGAATAALNLTVVDPSAAGFLTAYPCGTTKPNTSNVNFTAGQTVANLSIVKIGAGGKVCLVSDQPTHLIVDITTFDSGGGSPTPLPIGAASVGGCDIRPPSDPWNQDVTGLAVHPMSDTWVTAIGRSQRVHPDFGSNPDYGIPFTVVPESQPLVPVRFTDYADESDPGPYPLPPDAAIEAGSDAHVLVVQQGTCKLYETGNSAYGNGAWSASGGAIFDLKTSSYRPETWTSADAAGLPILPGLARYEEVRSGVITHALRFTAPVTQRGYIFPASHFAGTSNPNRPPMGARLRLRADFNTGGYSGDSLVILTALKKYGMILADNGSPWYVSGATDTRWNDDDLNQLKSVPATAFDVVYTGPTVTG